MDHAVSRCVRLAGGKYEHRKDWLEQRLRLLSEVCAVQVAGYAVMSNHLHVVLRMQPSAARGWSAASVVERWWTLYPRQRLRDGTPVPATAAQVRQRAQDAAWVETRRKRLADLGWRMLWGGSAIGRHADSGGRGDTARAGLDPQPLPAVREARRARRGMS